MYELTVLVLVGGVGLELRGRQRVEGDNVHNVHDSRPTSIFCVILPCNLNHPSKMCMPRLVYCHKREYGDVVINDVSSKLRSTG